MNCTKLIAALLAMLMLLILPVCAASDAAEAADAVTESAAEEPAQDNRMLFGMMLLSTVFAALIVSTCIFKGRDRSKFL